MNAPAFQTPPGVSAHIYSEGDFDAVRAIIHRESGIALVQGVAGSAGAAEGTAGSLAGYFTVWIVCGVTALCAAVLLCFVPKDAFQDRPSALPVA